VQSPRNLRKALVYVPTPYSREEGDLEEVRIRRWHSLLASVEEAQAEVRIRCRRRLLPAVEEEGQAEVRIARMHSHIRSYWKEEDQEEGRLEKASTAPAPASIPDKGPERANMRAEGN
jgi:hypothetical protein